MYKNKDVAFSFSSSTGLPDPLNGKQDAFRHAFFQAINVRDVPPRALLGVVVVSREDIVLAFANAHESEVPTSKLLEKEMDLFNNGYGITYCLTCSSTNTNAQIMLGLVYFLSIGELKYLKPLDSNGHIILGTTSIFWTNM